MRRLFKKKIKILNKPNNKIVTIKQAIHIIKKGGVVAYPTETFYGLAVNPTHVLAIKKLYQLKGREKNKPISLIISSEREVKKWAQELNPIAKKLMTAYWPGPLTLVFKAKKTVPSELSAGTKSVALRVSSCRVARVLAQKCGGAITATSANKSGVGPLTTPEEIIEKLGEKIDGVIKNSLKNKSKGSTILDISKNKIKVIREGDISTGEIEQKCRGTAGSLCHVRIS